ncbi:MAG: flagellar protein [Armatimonadetes bacterium]|nr:flagellar protein [Armatimonadota bacterium]
MSKITPGVQIERSSLGRPVPIRHGKANHGGFASALAKESERLEGLKISSHAQKRLNSSNVALSESDIRRIDGAVQRASEKGANQSLIMLDNLALIVSVKNRVVITAIDEARNKEGIFTNIDSVVIA